MKYRNSDFKNDTYYRKKEFFERLNIARQAGHDVLVNTIRILNNCPYARKIKGDVKIQEIFEDNWGEFLEIYKDKLRPAVIKNVEKMIDCKNLELGFSYYECPHCNNYFYCFHTCKSRFCPTCGKKYRDKISTNISKKIYKIPHRQLVFTMPFELRNYFREFRQLLNELFATVNETLNEYLRNHSKKKFKDEDRRLGLIQFLHTYGRDMKRHPHIHVLFAEAYRTSSGEFIKLDYLHYDYIRICFLNKLINKIRIFARREIKDKNKQKEIKKVLYEVHNKYVKGSYFYGKKQLFNTSIKSIKAIANYIARYASHPAISERRITKYDKANKTITWFYDPHEDDNKDEGDSTRLGRQYITEHVHEFMKRLIIHIPDEGFQTIRYYGFYANKFAKKSPSKATKLFSTKDIDDLILKLKWKFGLLYSFGYNPLLCHCGHEMVYVPEKSYFPGRDKIGGFP